MKRVTMFDRILRGCRCGGSLRTPGYSCPTLPLSTPVRTPDLAIYSQREEMLKGNIPNWDSRDINTNHWGPFRLKEEATVTVRNLSQETPAHNAIIHYSTAQFGIGTRPTRRLSKFASIPPNSEIIVKFPLEQEILTGDPRIGVFIEIEHPHDQNTINNFGAQVHDGGFTTESGRDFSVIVPIYNDSPNLRTIHLSLESEDLTATVTSDTVLESYNEKWWIAKIPSYRQVDVSISISVPDSLEGTEDSPLPRRAVTLIGWIAKENGEMEMLGGVTRLVSINNGPD